MGKIVRRIISQVGGDVGSEHEISLIVAVDRRGAGQERFAIKVGGEPVSHASDQHHPIVGVGGHVHSGNIGESLIVTVKLGVQDERLALSLGGRALKPKPKIGA